MIFTQKLFSTIFTCIRVVGKGSWKDREVGRSFQLDNLSNYTYADAKNNDFLEHFHFMHHDPDLVS